MLTLTLLPLQSGYSTATTDANRSESLPGGLSRSRSDLVGVTSRVKVTWSLSNTQVKAMTAFQRRVEETGEQFTLNLILDEALPTPHLCTLVPGSLKFGTFLGGSCQAQAELEVEPVTEYTSEGDETLMLLYEASPDSSDGAVLFFETLAELANDELAE